MKVIAIPYFSDGRYVCVRTENGCEKFLEVLPTHSDISLSRQAELIAETLNRETALTLARAALMA